MARPIGPWPPVPGRLEQCRRRTSRRPLHIIQDERTRLTAIAQAPRSLGPICRERVLVQDRLAESTSLVPTERTVTFRAAIAAACLLSGACSTSEAPPPEPSAARDPWQEARLRGIEFRALGQEPGWYLEIDEGQVMHLVYDYMERQATTPAPPPVVSGATRTYTAQQGSNTLSVRIEDGECHDIMSGFAFPARVTVTINGRELHGCGRDL